jgi:cysteinyl-tRNA synthetase
MKIYDTRTKTKKILRGKNIKMFVCGPTVYDWSHIGHARTYVFYDFFVKYLRRKKQVTYIQNITDIDDKIINRAKESKISPLQLARQWEKEYMKDMATLKITAVDRYERATDHIPEIISQTERLIEKGYAYQISDGIYYDVSKFKRYGQLSGRTNLKEGDSVSRVDHNKEKHQPADFCLWKLSKEKPYWPSPWGLGRPGWHIEDTAISEKYFGSSYDIHGGARDLIFPHHEAEVAQMEAITGKTPFVRFWVHTGFLTVEGAKMSKSLKNFITIREVNSSPRLLRYYLLRAHYRSPLDFHPRLLKEAENDLHKIDEFWNHPDGLKTKLYEEKFYQALDDDLNTPRALAILFQMIKEGNKKKLSNKKFLQEIDQFFNFLEPEKQIIPEEIKKLNKKRNEYREIRQWSKADEIREKIEKMGYEIKDTHQGGVVRKVITSYNHRNE